MPSYFFVFLPNYRQNFLICSHNLYYTSWYQKSILENKEHTFYNYFRVRFKGGIAVDEKESCKRQIVEMVESIENIRILKMIWGFVRRGYKEEKAGKWIPAFFKW